MRVLCARTVDVFFFAHEHDDHGAACFVTIVKTLICDEYIHSHDLKVIVSPAKALETFDCLQFGPVFIRCEDC